ncbi:hypothetical protein, partial [Thermocrispum agreste]|uniref:hypothetical protein n=1 Tax=Thermocrispum agreste TaxID=37925 RepID=UPI001B7FA1C6
MVELQPGLGRGAAELHLSLSPSRRPPDPLQTVPPLRDLGIQQAVHVRDQFPEPPPRAELPQRG